MRLDDIDEKLLLTWNKLLMKIKVKEEYIYTNKYGLSQKEKEINIDISSGRRDKTGKMIMVKKYNNSGDVDDLIKQLKKQFRCQLKTHNPERSDTLKTSIKMIRGVSGQ